MRSQGKGQADEVDVRIEFRGGFERGRQSKAIRLLPGGARQANQVGYRLVDEIGLDLDRAPVGLPGFVHASQAGVGMRHPQMCVPELAPRRTASRYSASASS